MEVLLCINRCSLNCMSTWQEKAQEQQILNLLWPDDTTASRPRALPGLQTLEGSCWELLPSQHLSASLTVDAAQWRAQYADLPRQMRHPKLSFQAWERRHVGIVERRQLRAPKSKHHCFQYGACLCKGRGLRVRKAHQRFQQHVKDMFTKDVLQDGSLVVEIWQVTAEGTDHVAFGQIALQYLSPLTTILLLLVSEDVIKPQKAGNKILKVDVEGFLLPLVELLERLDFRLEIRISMWRLWDSPLHANRVFSASLVEVEEVANSTTTIWAGRQEPPVREVGIGTGDGEHEDSASSADEFLPLLAPPLPHVARPQPDGTTSSSSSSTHSSNTDSDTSSSDSDSDGRDALEAAGVPSSEPQRHAEPSNIQELAEEPRAADAAPAGTPLDALPIHHQGHPIGMLLRYHAKSNDMYVNCTVPSHNCGSKCSLTRTCNASAKRKPQQGRPLGMLAAWAASANTFETKAAHMTFKPSLPQRKAARAALQRLPDAQPFLSYERKKRDGESSEPDECP